MTGERSGSGWVQGELFPATHVHKFEVFKGPVRVQPLIETVLPVNEFIFRYVEETNRWCWGCGSWIKFVGGVETERRTW